MSLAQRINFPLLSGMPDEEQVSFKITTNASGVPTLADSCRSKILTVTQPGTGRYRLTLSRKYNSVVLQAPSVKGNVELKVTLYDEDVDGSTPYVDLYLVNVFYPLILAGAYPHKAGTTPTLVTAPNASDLATLKTLCQDICLRVQAHDDDTNIHPTADTGNLAVAAWASTPGLPADLAECIAILNEVKSDWNTHVAKIHALGVEYHTGDDLRNSISAPNAADQPTSETLANAFKAKFNQSVVAKPQYATQYADLVSSEIRGTLVLRNRS